MKITKSMVETMVETNFLLL